MFMYCTLEVSNRVVVANIWDVTVAFVLDLLEGNRNVPIWVAEWSHHNETRGAQM